jgi:uncharacterized protein (TIGR02058 family)
LSEKRFVVQIGCGVDQHGHKNDCTKAAQKAIKNAISNNSLPGLLEICNLEEPKDLLSMIVHIKIGAPYPEKIDKDKVMKAVPFGQKTIEIVRGGLVAQGVMIKELGDTSDEILICNAAVTVSVKL